MYIWAQPVPTPALNYKMSKGDNMNNNKYTDFKLKLKKISVFKRLVWQRITIFFLLKCDGKPKNLTGVVNKRIYLI